MKTWFCRCTDIAVINTQYFLPCKETNIKKSNPRSKTFMRQCGRLKAFGVLHIKLKLSDQLIRRICQIMIRWTKTFGESVKVYVKYVNYIIILCTSNYLIRDYFLHKGSSTHPDTAICKSQLLALITHVCTHLSARVYRRCKRHSITTKFTKSQQFSRC